MFGVLYDVSMTTYYDILGIPNTATFSEISSAFRNLAKTKHPDAGGSTEEFQKISEAYSVLSDSNKRAEYDAQLNHHSSTINFDLSSIFNNIFSSTFDAGTFNRTSIQTYRTVVKITLEEVLTGKEDVLQLWLPTQTIGVKVKIPKGSLAGTTLRYNNIIGPNTVLFVVVEVEPHLTFTAKGYNLFVSIPISTLDLLLGTTISVPTLSGKTEEVMIPPFSQPTNEIVMSGFGLPKSDGTSGDQIVLLNPFTPTTLSDEFIQLLKNQLNGGTS